MVTGSKPRRRDTDERRVEKKRIQDRLAQRATRERTKNRIAFLEQRLQSLEASDKQGEISSLTRIIDDLRNDNHRLRNALVKVRTAVDQIIPAMEDHCDGRNSWKACGCSTNLDCSCRTTSRTTSPTHLEHTGPPVLNNQAHRHDSTPTEASDVSEVVHGNLGLCQPDTVDELNSAETFFDFNPNALLEMFEMGTTSPNAWDPATPSPLDFRLPSTETIKTAPDIDKWHVSNGAFTNALNSVKKRAGPNLELDLHVPFKAAIWGWDNVGPEAQHPVWLALRQVDQRVFGSWKSKAQRVALMYVCQTLMQYRESPTKENLARVPNFFRPRPSQETIQHPAVIDFLIWPGLRDRLVFEHKKYTATGALSAAFVKNFNFYWPYSDRDIFGHNPATDRYEVSKVFLEYVYSFKNWTMRPGFFQQFPEMQDDIAMFEEPPNFPGAAWTV
ncbi:hypothetical protein LTS15_009407 [Exophiala xenobiotica]|nr:hypothetical protein LTS15_009407 [Exophiala xenobiotica]